MPLLNYKKKLLNTSPTGCLKCKKTIVVCFFLKNKIMYVLTLPEFNEIFFLNRNDCDLNRSSIITYIKTLLAAYFSSYTFWTDSIPIADSRSIPDLLYIEFSYIMDSVVSENNLHIEFQPLERFTLSDLCQFYLIHKDPVFKEPASIHGFKDHGCIAFTRAVIDLINETKGIT